MQAIVRKYLTLVETTRREMGKDLAAPTRKAAAIAVIENPFAGQDAQDLEPLIEIGEELGGVLGEMAVTALGLAPAAIESYGKAAIVGEAGESSMPRRSSTPSSASRCAPRSRRAPPSSLRRKKWAASGRRSTSRSATRTPPTSAAISTPWRCGVPDAPRAGEIVVAIVVTDGGRPRPRVGGLTKDQIEGKDGLR